MLTYGKTQNASLVSFPERGKIIPLTRDEFEKYIKGSITLTFDATGGSVETNTLTAYVGREIGALPVPTRDYHTFEGWYTDKDGGVKITANTQVTAVGEVTYYAHWKLNDAVGPVLEKDVPADGQPLSEYYTYDVVTTNSGLTGYTNKSSEWGPWGDWSGYQTSSVSKSDYCDVRTRSQSKQVYDHTEWNYSRWQGIDPSTGRRGWTGYAKGYFGDHYCGYYNEYGWTRSRLSCCGYDDGIAKYDGGTTGYWYYENSRDVTRTEYYTEYSYCTRDLIYTYSFESETYPTGDATNIQHWITYIPA